MSKTACVFPGQGKKFGRAELELLERNSAKCEMADEILGYHVRDLIQNDRDKLIETRYAQPVGYLTSCLYYLEMLENTGRKPDYVIGHSLGEFCALTAGGFIGLEKGIDLVRKRGEIMSGADGGAMCAVMGKSCEDIMSAIESEAPAETDIANYNSPFQIIISGPEAAIKEAEERMAARGLKTKRLGVSGAFHSRYMREACDEFRKVLLEFPFNKGGEPEVMSSVEPVLYGDDVPAILGEQIVKPVRWMESVEKLIDMDCYDFVQADKGNVMIDLIDNIKFARALKGRV